MSPGKDVVDESNVKRARTLVEAGYKIYMDHVKGASD